MEHPAFEIHPHTSLFHLRLERCEALPVDVFEMGDVADILGLGGVASTSGRASPVLGGPLGPLQENRRGKGAAPVPLKKGKPQGVSREVYALLGSEGLPPEVRTRSVLGVALSCIVLWVVVKSWCHALPCRTKHATESL